MCFAAYAATVVTPTIKVTPATASVRTAETQTFTAAASGIAAPATIVWKVVSTAASSSADVGTVTSKGVYTAPAAVPAPNTVLVQAVDSADSKVFASSAVTILSPLPTIASLAPTQINTGLAYTLDIKGANFLASSQVLFDGKAVASKFGSSTLLTVAGTSTAAAGTKISITVVNPGPSATSTARDLSVVAPVQVQASPDKQTLRLGATKQFSARVVNNSDQVVTWQVAGGAVNGTIDVKGLYTPPSVLPVQTIPVTPGNPPGATTVTTSVPLPLVTIVAASEADPTAKASVTLSLENGMPTITTVTPASLTLGSANLTVAGTGFAPGAVIVLAGSRLATTFVSDRKLTATATVTMPVGRVAAIKVVNPNPGSLTSAVSIIPVRPTTEQMTYVDAVRFLEMASFGPTPSGVAHLQSIGRDKWLAEQFATAASPLPDPLDDQEGVGRLQDAFFTNALTANDQLRQRVALALGHIMVVSSVKDMKYAQMVSYQRLLLADAFGNFRTLLEDMTLNPAMGYFLDMVNNDKANPSKNTVANENYAREVMQLFTVGLNQLDPTTGAPGAPEYDQNTVTQMAKVFTGWTYAADEEFASHWRNPAFYFAPMVPFEEHHDTTAKYINLPKPCTILAGGTAAGDLTQALDCLAGQTNVAPFISYRLIQALVMSGPSQAYVNRVAAIFNGTHGDLKAIVTGILTDTEAAAASTGKLREPVLYSTSLLRALSATVTGDATGVRGQSQAMGQDVLDAPSVFSYFSPYFRVGIPNAPPAVAPEFQLVNAETAFARINFAFRAAANQVSGNVRVDFTNLADLAGDPAALTEAVNQALYRGLMDGGEKTAILAGINASTDPLTRVRNAFYVAAGAPQYQVEQ